MSDWERPIVVLSSSGVKELRRLQAENAKLRELARDMWGWLNSRTVPGAALYDIRGRMRELGVEVPE